MPRTIEDWIREGYNTIGSIETYKFRTERVLKEATKYQKEAFHKLLISVMAPRFGNAQFSVNPSIGTFYDQGLLYRDPVFGFQLVSDLARQALQSFLLDALKETLRPLNELKVVPNHSSSYSFQKDEVERGIELEKWVLRCFLGGYKGKAFYAGKEELKGTETLLDISKVSLLRLLVSHFYQVDHVSYFSAEQMAVAATTDSDKKRTWVITTVDPGRRNCFYVPEERNFPYWDAVYVDANNSLLFIQVSCNKDVQAKFSKANAALTKAVPVDVDKCKRF